MPSVFDLPFNEAAAYFKDKLNIPTNHWDDLMNEEQAKAFMSAGAAKADLLADLRGAVDKAIDGKMPLPEFKKQFDGIVKKHGWQYRGERNWRSELIWRQNISTAYQAGRWQQFDDSDTEYLVYRHLDGQMNPRPTHQAWNGTVLPKGDPWWDTHFAPNGFGCKCKIYRATGDEYQSAPNKGKRPDNVPPDKGFAYNPGKAWRGDRPDDKGDTWEPLPYHKSQNGKPLPIDKTVSSMGPEVHDKAGMVQAVKNAIGGNEAFIQFHKGDLRQDVYMNAEWVGNHLALNRGQYVPFLRETITDPAEIRMLFEKNVQTGRVRLSLNFIKGIDVGKDKVVFLVSRIIKGIPNGWTFISSRKSEINRLRKGKLMYER